MKIVIGIDPDVSGHGVAFYFDGRLASLKKLSRREIIEFCRDSLREGNSIEVAIEDVISNTSTWRAGGAISKQVAAKMGHGIGRLNQSARELVDDLNEIGITISMYKPSSEWKASKGVFELATGWKSRSNEDTRSAAYFGWIKVMGSK